MNSFIHYSNSLRLILMLSLFLCKWVNWGSEKLNNCRLKELKQDVSQDISDFKEHTLFLTTIRILPFFHIKLLSSHGFLSLYSPHILGVMCLKYRTIMVLDKNKAICRMIITAKGFFIIHHYSIFCPKLQYCVQKKPGVLPFWKDSCSPPV